MKTRKIITHQEEWAVFEVTAILSIKGKVIEIKYYQLKNILIKLDLLKGKLKVLRDLLKIWYMENPISDSN